VLRLQTGIRVWACSGSGHNAAETSPDYSSDGAADDGADDCACNGAGNSTGVIGLCGTGGGECGK
jgi:hypothetical protein